MKLTHPLRSSGNARQYFVAAEEVEWDYIPSGENFTQLRGVALPLAQIKEQLSNVWPDHPFDFVGWDNMRGVPIAESPVTAGSDFIPSSTSIGHKYIKVR